MHEETRQALELTFDKVGNEPANWLFLADNLRLAARLLEPYFPVDLTDETDYDLMVMSGRLQGPILMLRGCAVECLLKALYVARDNKLAEDGRYVSPGGKDHDLVHLAEQAAVGVTCAQRALLGYLGHFIAQGRYPIPKRAPEAFPQG